MLIGTVFDAPMRVDDREFAALVNGWQWRLGHLAWDRHTFPDTLSVDPQLCRVTAIDSRGIRFGPREHNFWRQLGDVVPDLWDLATRDGLPRTARALWKRDALFASNWQDGVTWHVYKADGRGVFSTVCAIVASGPTEDDAWVTAIGAAPPSPGSADDV